MILIDHYCGGQIQQYSMMLVIKCICKTAINKTGKNSDIRVKSEVRKRAHRLGLPHRKAQIQNRSLRASHTHRSCSHYSTKYHEVHKKTILLSAHTYFHTHTNTYMHAHAHTPSSLLSRPTVELRLQQLRLPLKLT